MGRGIYSETAMPSSAGWLPPSGFATTGSEADAVVGKRYVLEAYLGESRYGQVYKALDRSLSDPQLRLEHHVGLHLLGDEIRSQTHLLRKLESSYQQPHLWSHPNIVKIRGFGSDRGTYYLSMELLEGSSLRAVLDDVRPNLLPRARAFALLKAVGDALSYAHVRGVVHGNIRPEKVFVTTDGTVKVLDLLPGTAIRNTPFFVEDTAEGGLSVQDTRDDVYGLACLAYELLSGDHPFHGASPIDAVSRGLVPAAIGGLGLGRWEALAHGLALRRSERTFSVEAFLDELGIAARREPSHNEWRATNRTLAIAESTSRQAGDGAPVTSSGSTPPVGPATADPEAPVALLPARRDERLAVSEAVVSLRDVHAYLGYAERRDRREPKNRGVIGVVLVVTLGIVAYAAYSKYAELLRGRVARLVDEIAHVVPPATPPAVERKRAIGVPMEAGLIAAPVVEAPAAELPLPSDRAAEAESSRASVMLVAETAAASPAAIPSTDSGADVVGPEPTSFEFATGTVTVAESMPAAAVSILRRGGTREAASVTWWTTPGTALAGADYADLGRQTATFAPGQQTSTIYVPIISDSVPEARESFGLNLAVGNRGEAPLTPTAQAEVIIEDDD